MIPFTIGKVQWEWVHQPGPSPKVISLLNSKGNFNYKNNLDDEMWLKLIQWGHGMPKTILLWLAEHMLVLTRSQQIGCFLCPAYTGCNRRKGPDFGRVFLMLNYTEKPQKTYIQSWTVWEIMASEVWNFDSCYTLTENQIRIETGRNMWFL